MTKFNERIALSMDMVNLYTLYPQLVTFDAASIDLFIAMVFPLFPENLQFRYLFRYVNPCRYVIVGLSHVT